jgi:hypothetical protein
MRISAPEDLTAVRGRHVGGQETSRGGSRRFDEGRVCAEDGCVTVLSVYNSSDLCWQHEAPHPYFVRVPRRRRSHAA